MQLVRYHDGRESALGVIKGDAIVSISRALQRHANPDGRLESGLDSVVSVLGREPKVLFGLGSGVLDVIGEAVAADDGSAVVSDHGLTGMTVLPFIHNPMKVFGIGYNNKTLCEQENKPLPDQPEVFAKMPTCVIGPYDDVRVPKSHRAC